MKVTDIALAVNEKKAKQEEVGIRPGEKLHEQMIGIEDTPYTFEYPDYFKILPAINQWFDDPKIGKGMKVDENFTYRSDNNKEWMKITELKAWLMENANKIGKFNHDPYGRQDITQEDLDAVRDVLTSDFLKHKDTKYQSLKKIVSEHCGANHAVAVNSATSALHIACLALGLKKEIIFGLAQFHLLPQQIVGDIVAQK